MLSEIQTMSQVAVNEWNVSYKQTSVLINEIDPNEL